ncbi:MAG: tetratricopeptide repeat protein [Deltaproteobacteria bacterium]|nr:tetratricopeptide repeat protein [Deltaproteobacteria bacterium]
MQNSVKEKGLFTVFLTIIFMIGIFTFTACDIDDNLTEDFADTDTYEAQLDAAVILIDAGNYQTAKDIIDDLLLIKPGNEYLLELRASCYVGIAGIDSLSALEKIDNVDDAGDVDTSDIISTILGDANGEITAASVADKLTNLDNALTDLESISNPTDDQLSQIALFSAYRIIANITEQFISVTGTDPVDLTDPNLLDTGWSDGQIDTIPAATITEMASDFNNMLNIPSTNPLSDPFNELKDSMTYPISDAELTQWLKDLD